MPILNIQFSGQGVGPDGKTAAVPPQFGLTQRGPIVQVTGSVGQPIAEQLLQQGKTLPAPVSGLALIDTGASSTCIDAEAAQQLHLPVIDVVTVASASHAASRQNVHPIQIEVVGLPITVEAPRAIAAELKAQGLLVLIGRDVLQHSVLVYNGPAGSFSWSI